MALTDFTILDVIALVWFLACWIGFGQYAKRSARSKHSLIGALRVYRERWMQRMCAREQHQADATLLANLIRNALFFVSTTMFILAGLVALLGTAQRVTELVAGLPFTAPFALWVWELKVLLLIYLFIYAFFKFSWSAWQYNALSIVIGAAPQPPVPEDEAKRYVEVASRIAALAGDSFNLAIRTYYYSMAVVTWFLHPLVLIVAATWVTFVLYRREFVSPTREALLIDVEGGEGRSR
jgi:uncharacterized membrane protein